MLFFRLVILLHFPTLSVPRGYVPIGIETKEILAQYWEEKIRPNESPRPAKKKLDRANQSRKASIDRGARNAAASSASEKSEKSDKSDS